MNTIDDLNRYLLKYKNSLCVLMFTSSDCGPCKRIKPEFLKLAQELKFNPVLLDIKENSALFQEFDINSVPRFRFCKVYTKNVELLDDELKGPSLKDLKEMIIKHMEL